MESGVGGTYVIDACEDDGVGLQVDVEYSVCITY